MNSSTVSKYLIPAYTISSLIPLAKSDVWWIRAWDFPRLQLLGLGLLFGLTYLLKSNESPRNKIIFLSLLLPGLGFDLYRVLPYSPLWPKESLKAELQDPSRRLSLITANVLQSNDKFEKLLSIIQKKNPDMVLLLEVDSRWVQALSELKSNYPHQILQPQENTYGIALYSKLPLKGPEVKFLIDPEIPSIYTRVTLASGEEIDLFGLHPRPPRPQDGPSTERDAEIIQVAKTVRDSQTPTVVLGDLNDVAWSHTTRLFRRVSGLLDPRVGREPFPTFPVYLPFFRFPLDHVFHSKSLRLILLERLPSFGSDHFPIAAVFHLEPSGKNEQKGVSLEEGDLKEAQKTIQKARDPKTH